MSVKFYKYKNSYDGINTNVKKAYEEKVLSAKFIQRPAVRFVGRWVHVVSPGIIEIELTRLGGFLVTTAPMKICDGPSIKPFLRSLVSKADIMNAGVAHDSGYFNSRNPFSENDSDEFGVKLHHDFVGGMFMTNKGGKIYHTCDIDKIKRYGYNDRADEFNDFIFCYLPMSKKQIDMMFFYLMVQNVEESEFSAFRRRVEIWRREAALSAVRLFGAASFGERGLNVSK